MHVILVVGLLLVIPLTSVHAAEEAPACSIDPAFAWLDFWVGEWDVSVQGKPVGTNSIQKILNDCAITEEEKIQVARFEDGGIRFQGEIMLPEGGRYLDRTTLTPIKENEVRQHIEISLDGGESWQTVFDGLYARRKEE